VRLNAKGKGEGEKEGEKEIDCLTEADLTSAHRLRGKLDADRAEEIGGKGKGEKERKEGRIGG